MKQIIIFCGFLMLLVLNACQWQTQEYVDAVAWSDDAQEQAFVVLRYDERTAYPLNGSKEIARLRHQLYVQKADGSSRRPLTGERPRANGTHLFYMKKAGYVLYDVQDGDTVNYDIVRMGAAPQTFASMVVQSDPCNGLEVVPSPDGLTLAKLTRAASGASCNITAGLYDAVTLALKQESMWSTDAPAQLTWTTSNEVIVWTPKQAWKIAEHNVVATVLPKCSFPVTTSSTVSPEGVLIGPADPAVLNSSDIPIEIVSTGNPVFGCQ
jgi:hypothetical protein